MAWSFGGDWTGKKTQDIKYIMSDLCRAVNERIALISPVGENLISFHYGGGSATKNYPTPDDFDGMFLDGGARILANMNAMKSAIQALLSTNYGTSTYEYSYPWAYKTYWMKSGTGPYNSSWLWAPSTTYYWSESNLLTEVGLGNFPAAFTRVQNATDWLRFKNLLNYMKYFYVVNVAAYINDSSSFPGIWDGVLRQQGTGTKKYGESLVENPSDHDEVEAGRIAARANAIAATETATSPPSGASLGTENYYLGIVQNSRVEPYPSLDHYETCAIFNSSYTHQFAPGGDIQRVDLHCITEGGQETLFSAGGIAATYDDYEKSTCADVAFTPESSCASLSKGRCVKIEMEQTSVPECYVRPNHIKVWTDLTDDLTDQAEEA